MPTLPVDIVNRAFDECGIEELGDMEDGSLEARVASRWYTPTLYQLLSAAYWNFARKQESLVLMADVGGVYISNTDVPAPWSYMYEWPAEAVAARFVPATDGNVDAQGNSLNTNLLAWNAPSPFLVTSANRINDPAGNWGDVQGHDPEQTKVILSNNIGASLVYTGIMQYPDAWDPLFEQAMVAVLAARFAMPLVKDKAQARAIRGENVALAREALNAARVRDGNEGWTVVNHTPDWIMARTSYMSFAGPGVLCYPWTSMPMLDDAGASF
jgi:hypothetical protein